MERLHPEGRGPPRVQGDRELVDLSERPDVFPYYHSSAAGKGFNIPGYQDPKLDDLLVQGQSASDLEARKAVYKQLQAYTSDTLPYLFLWYPQEIDVLSSLLKGVPELGLRDAMQYIGEWWLAKR